MKLSRNNFKQNLVEALESKDCYVSDDMLEKLLNLNYDEDSSLTEWTFSDFLGFASEFCACSYDLWETARSYDLHYPGEDDDNIVYEVHSDIDENNVYAEFDNEKDAIKYAKECDAQCWVDKVIYALNGDFLESDTVWAYTEAEEDDK